MLRDQGRTSKALFLGIGFLVLSTIILVVWFFLIGGTGSCKVEQLCDTRDRTSYVSESQAPRNFEFLVPTKLLWVAMLTASIGLLVASCYAFVLLKKRVGTLAMAEFSNRIRQSAQFFFLRVLLLVAVSSVLMFILVGVGPGWRIAGGFAIGCLLSLSTCFLNSKISFAGNARVSGAALENVLIASKLGLRTGSVMGLVLAGLALVGISATYLMYEDVRAVAGFAFGASIVALASRLGGGIFSKAADIGADALVGSNGINAEDHPENPAVVADITGDVLGSIYGGAADYSASFAASIAATAMLGSSLPFFQRNQFAMCVFNHLYVDNRCGQFGYPQQLSYATFICKTDDFYLQYPRLSVWQSNALFVALPFLLASVGLLASVVATAKFHVPSDKTASESEGESTPVRYFRTAQINNVLSALLLIAGSAALCFILFGGSSSFQKAAGLGGNELLPAFKLSSDSKACMNTFLLDSSTAVTLPSGEFADNGYYKPTSTLGFEFSQARWTAWRLFACILIGICLGQITDMIGVYYTMTAYPPMQAAERAERYGAGAYIAQVMGDGMMSTLIPMILTAASVLGTYNLFGFYGIALCSVALLSTTGVNVSTSALGTFADMAAGTLRSCRHSLPERTESSAAAMSAVACACQAAGSAAYNVSALFTACGVLAALVNESGLTPSSRDLVGTPRILGRVVQSAATLADTYVIASMFIGFCIPFIVTGLLFVSVHTISRSVVHDFKRAAAEDAAQGRKPGGGAHDRYKAYIQSLTRSSLLAVVFPFSGVIMTPLIVGFGFGQRALVGVLVSTVAASYLLSTMMIHSGGLWAVAKRKSLEHSGLDGGAASILRKDAVRSGDAVGDVFKNTAGPVLNAYAITATLVGLVAVSAMQPDGRKGWIGAVLLLVYMVLGLAYTVWWARDSRSRSRAPAQDAGDDDEFGQIPAPAKRVSPFYERRTTYVADTVVPGSQMHDAMLAAEQEQVLGDPGRLPGMSDRDTIDRERLAAARAT